MIESMTGFGRGSARVGDVIATVEMRSVNNRFCEVSVRLPRALSEQEAEIQARVKQALARGRITVQVQVEQASADVLPIRVDAGAARAYARLLEQLSQAAGITEPVRLEHLLTFSDVFTLPQEASTADGAVREAVQAALEEAIDGIRTMRRQEGRALQEDLELRLHALEAALQAVEQRAPERAREARERLHERLEELFGEERINAERLEFEIALLADKLDVTEECVRLRSHLQLFREALVHEEPVGRKLNFLVQEINREVNTIGSKANDADIAHRAVQMKEELERVREQVQNIE